MGRRQFTVVRRNLVAIRLARRHFNESRDGRMSDVWLNGHYDSSSGTDALAFLPEWRTMCQLGPGTRDKSSAVCALAEMLADGDADGVLSLRARPLLHALLIQLGCELQGVANGLRVPELCCRFGQHPLRLVVSVEPQQILYLLFHYQ